MTLLKPCATPYSQKYSPLPKKNTNSLPNRFSCLQMIVVSMDASNSYKYPPPPETQNCFLYPTTAARNLLIESSVSKWRSWAHKCNSSINGRSKLLLRTSGRPKLSPLGNCSPRKSSKCSQRLRSPGWLPSKSVQIKRSRFTVQLGNCAARPWFTARFGTECLALF